MGLSRAHRTRLLLASVAITAAVALSGCQVEGPYSVAKHMRPLSAEMTSLLEKKGMSKSSPMLVRVFKEESELEVWKQDSTGQFALLKTYPICRWSGQLGPKMREGDRQAPEGFYAIRPGQMNPNSSFYLSFDLGYPNAFDRAHGRTGAHLMVHGDCSSRGCYSMTDEQIAELFALGRDAFFSGQKSFQVQAYPFRMTALNMAKHRNSPHMSFWKNLKEGYDHFEVTRQEPKVEVCEKRYVFNAQAPQGSTTPLAFKAAEKCPAYEVDPTVASAVAEKTRSDNQAFADFVRRNTPTVPVNTGRDGGMHASFAAIYQTKEVRNARGQVTGVVVERRAPSLGPAEFNRPPEISDTPSSPALVATAQPGGTAANVPLPRPSPWKARSVASTPSRTPATTATAYTASTPAPAAQGQAGNFFSSLYSSSVGAVGGTADSVKRFFGGGQQVKPEPQTRAQRTRTARPNQQRKQATPQEARHTPAAPRPSAAAAVPAQAPGVASAPAQTAQAAAPAASRPAAASSLMPGAAPVVPSNNFENRWQGSLR